MTDQQRALFFSVIAYGVTFIGALLVAGVALDKPLVVGMAVLVAGGAYLAQVTMSIAADVREPALLVLTSQLLWVATCGFGTAAAIMVIF